MTLLRDRIHHLIDQLSDEDLQEIWPVLQRSYYDVYMLEAIQAAKRSLQPGDSLNYEEARQLLYLL